MTPHDIITALPTVFVPARADGINADVQLHLTGDQGGDWVVSVRNQTCTVALGTTTNPRLHITSDAQDFVNLVMGKTDPMMAFMTGRLRLKGDISLATRFPGLFKA
jgi:putative sterol carrier protein